MTPEALYGWLFAVVLVAVAAGVLSSYFVALHTTRRVQAHIDSLLHRQAEQRERLNTQQGQIWELEARQTQAQEAILESIHWRKLVNIYQEANPEKGKQE